MILTCFPKCLLRKFSSSQSILISFRSLWCYRTRNNKDNHDIDISNCNISLLYYVSAASDFKPQKWPPFNFTPQHVLSVPQHGFKFVSCLVSNTPISDSCNVAVLFARFKKLAIERSLSIADHRVLQLNFDGLSPMSCRHWECPPVLTFINWTFHSAGVQPLILN